ncbi:MAG: hypothetical protein ABW166_19520 [Sedimenticola sp.]
MSSLYFVLVVGVLSLLCFSGGCPLFSRAIREGKRGAIPSDIPPILQRMGLEPDAFVNHLRGHKGRPHPVVLGPVGKIRAAAKQLGQRFFKGMGESRVLYST